MPILPKIGQRVYLCRARLRQDSPCYRLPAEYSGVGTIIEIEPRPNDNIILVIDFHYAGTTHSVRFYAKHCAIFT